jgi:hypothetical protein
VGIRSLPPSKSLIVLISLFFKALRTYSKGSICYIDIWFLTERLVFWRIKKISLDQISKGRKDYYCIKASSKLLWTTVLALPDECDAFGVVLPRATKKGNG